LALATATSTTARQDDGSTMALTNPLEFMQQVRGEVAKVTWPTRNETFVTTIFVLIMVIAAALFFFAADQLINLGLKSLLDFFRTVRLFG
jgi:preprotein translocase subunit SecE